jgi:hypothetical protein
MKHINLYDDFNANSMDESMVLKNPGNGIVDGFSCKKLYDLDEDQMWNAIKYLDAALVGKKKVTVEGKEYNIIAVNVGGCPGGRYERPCNAFTILIDKPMPKNGIFSAQTNSTVYFLSDGKILLETSIGAEKVIPTTKELTEIFNLGKKFFDKFKA